VAQSFLESTSIFETLDEPQHFKSKSRVLVQLMLWVAGACRLSQEQRVAYTDDLLMKNFLQQPAHEILAGLTAELQKQTHHRLSEANLLRQATLLAEEALNQEPVPAVTEVGHL